MVGNLTTRLVEELVKCGSSSYPITVMLQKPMFESLRHLSFDSLGVLLIFIF